jgi:hypothetical protein
MIIVLKKARQGQDDFSGGHLLLVSSLTDRVLGPFA